MTEFFIATLVVSCLLLNILFVLLFNAAQSRYEKAREENVELTLELNKVKALARLGVYQSGEQPDLPESAR